MGGVDKGAIEVGGMPILDRELAAAASLADRVLLVGGHPRVPEGALVRAVPDRVEGAGAMGGLYTALCEAATPYVLVLACDLPFVGPRLLERLAALADGNADAVVPRTRDGWQPLCAVYARRIRHRVRRRIDSGHLKVQDLLAGIRVRELGPDAVAAIDPGGQSFINVNTPGDLGRAVRLAARADRRTRR
jgi:molybdopterin-guanine dinucleotide biosynthesis protein A